MTLPTVKQSIGVQFFVKHLYWKKLGFLFWFCWFLFSRWSTNIEESLQVFLLQKSLEYWIPDNMYFLSASNEGNHQFSMFLSSLVFLFLIFHANGVSGNLVLANMRMILHTHTLPNRVRTYEQVFAKWRFLGHTNIDAFQWPIPSMCGIFTYICHKHPPFMSWR